MVLYYLKGKITQQIKKIKAIIPIRKNGKGFVDWATKSPQKKWLLGGRQFGFRKRQRYQTQNKISFIQSSNISTNEISTNRTLALSKKTSTLNSTENQSQMQAYIDTLYSKILTNNAIE